MNKWRCEHCNTFNDEDKPRCGLCSTPRPEKLTFESNKARTVDLTQQLHNIIERLTPLQQKKTLRYFEDNFL